MTVPGGRPPLPNLVVAGVTKAGTTSLHAFLAQHPDVFAPRTKELNHFSPLVHGRQPAGLASYAAHFADAGDERWRLDCSPFYFVGGAVTARAVTATLDRPRVVITLRDPVARLWSSFAYKRSKGLVPATLPFGAFVEECLARYRDGSDLTEAGANHLTLRTGAYAGFLGAWVDQLGPDLRLVYAEELAADPRAVLDGLFAWLGVDPAAGPLDVAPRNATVQSRSVALRRLAYAVDARAKPLLPAAAQRRLKAAYARLNAGPPMPGMTPDERAQVTAFYAEHAGDLVAVLQRAGVDHLPAWLRDTP